MTGPGSSAANPFTSQPFTIDQTPPTVGSISLVDPALTNLTTVHYTVTFSEPVLDVELSDFVLVPSAGVTGTISAICPTTCDGKPDVYGDRHRR